MIRVCVLGGREQKEITGDVPLDLSGFCGSHVNGMLYIFGGCDPSSYTNQVSLGANQRPASTGHVQLILMQLPLISRPNWSFLLLQMFRLDLTEQSFSWMKVTDTKGQTPSPRNKHSCWTHRDRSVPCVDQRMQTSSSWLHGWSLTSQMSLLSVFSI